MNVHASAIGFQNFRFKINPLVILDSDRYTKCILPWKPSIKNIWILIYFHTFSVFLTSFYKGFFRASSNYIVFFTIFTLYVPNWHPVPPPELSAYAPVFNIWKPMIINLQLKIKRRDLSKHLAVAKLNQFKYSMH